MVEAQGGGVADVARPRRAPQVGKEKTNKGFPQSRRLEFLVLVEGHNLSHLQLPYLRVTPCQDPIEGWLSRRKVKLRRLYLLRRLIVLTVWFYNNHVFVCFW